MYPIKIGRPAKNYVGERFGKLTVVEKISKVGAKESRFMCECDCGGYKEAALSNLKKGRVKSCGCILKGMMTKHGYRYHELYATWKAMMHRCYNPKAFAYKTSYGGVGVTVCPEWRDVKSFCEGLERLLGKRPEGHTLDRIDPFGNYEPSNVRWATHEEQQNNRRDNFHKT